MPLHRDPLFNLNVFTGLEHDLAFLLWLALLPFAQERVSMQLKSIAQILLGLPCLLKVFIKQSLCAFLRELAPVLHRKVVLLSEGSILLPAVLAFARRCNLRVNRMKGVLEGCISRVARAFDL